MTTKNILTILTVIGIILSISFFSKDKIITLLNPVPEKTNDPFIVFNGKNSYICQVKFMENVPATIFTVKNKNLRIDSEVLPGSYSVEVRKDGYIYSWGTITKEVTKNQFLSMMIFLRKKV